MSVLPPAPVADRDTQLFWDAVARGSLEVQRCAGCDAWVWQPRPICPRCHGTDLRWTEVSGSGGVASWTVLHPPVLEVWASRVPFVVLLVELDAGVRMLGQLVDDEGVLLQTDGTAEGLTFGARVALRWRTDEAGTRLPAWTLVS